ncbi:MAG: YtxH domain-containing protein [Gemmatimonadales bacterium]|nr:YtxH domain-containing protein [Gemmatimonadales bacterium]
MTKRQRKFDDADFDFGDRGRGAGVTTIFLATALGVGIGLLAAPDAGLKTRRRLRKRFETLGEDLGEGLEEMQGLSGRARERMRDRLSRMKKRGEDAWEGLEDRWHGEEEEEDSGAFGAVLAVAAGVAATYFLTSDRAAPARSRVRETAETVRRQATDRWEQYQQQRGEARGNGQPGNPGETRSGAIPSDESPQGS